MQCIKKLLKTPQCFWQPLGFGVDPLLYSNLKIRSGGFYGKR